MISSATRTLDTADLSLEDIGTSVQDLLTRTMAEVHSAADVVRVLSVTVLPVTAPYRLPDPDSHHRDFHYTDRGFLVIIVYEET